MTDQQTPSSNWFANGEPDPHAGRYDCERHELTMGKLTDDELANGAFMNYDVRPALEGIIAGTHFSPIAWMTAVKDRIRWLSRKLEWAKQEITRLEQWHAEVADDRNALRVRLTASERTTTELRHEANQLRQITARRAAMLEAVGLRADCTEEEAQEVRARLDKLKGLEGQAVKGPSGETVFGFSEGQWWLDELDAMVANGTLGQRRAGAVVRNLLETAHAAAGAAPTPEVNCDKCTYHYKDADMEPCRSCIHGSACSDNFDPRSV